MRTLLLASALAALLLSGCAGEDTPTRETAIAPTERDDLVLDAARAALEVPAAPAQDLGSAAVGLRELAVQPLPETDESERLKRDRRKAERYETERKAMAEMEKNAELHRRTQGRDNTNRLAEGVDE